MEETVIRFHGVKCITGIFLHGNRDGKTENAKVNEFTEQLVNKDLRKIIHQYYYDTSLGKKNSTYVAFIKRGM